MLSAFYYLTIISFILIFLVHFTRFCRHEIKIAIPGLLFNAGALLLIIIQSGRFSGYTVFESFLFTTFILGCLAVFFPAGGGFQGTDRRIEHSFHHNTYSFEEFLLSRVTERLASLHITAMH